MKALNTNTTHTDMKKYILMVLCMACTTNIMAQKDLVIHKKDGTILRIPMDMNPALDFWGKTQTKDNDYVTVSEISGKLISHDITVSTPEGSNYNLWTYDECGVVVSATPGVTIENGLKASLIDDEYIKRHYQIEGDSLDYETPYYYRAYVCKYGLTYYSEEKSHIFYQDISSFIGYTPEWDFEQSAYVMPTDTAFKIGFKEFTGIECSDTSLVVLKGEWKAYLTQDIAKELIAKGGELKKCHEGDLLYINEVGSDFFEALFTEGVFNIDIPNSINYENDYTRNCETPLPKVDCDESWGIEGNAYWITTPTTNMVQPQIAVNLPYALPGYSYKISVIFAPDTRAEADTLATRNKVRFNFFGSDEYGLFPSRGTSIYIPGTKTRDFEPENALKCDTIDINIEAESIKRSMLQIVSNISSRLIKEGKHSREIRIAGIIVERKKKETTE